MNASTNKSANAQSGVTKSTNVTNNVAEPTPTSAQRYETILVERRERVGLITLNRPKSLNALNVHVS